MFPLNDALDILLLGGFLFGLIFTVMSLLLGFADVGFDADSDLDGDGWLLSGTLNLSSVLAFITWSGGVGYLLRNGAGFAGPIAVVGGLVAGVLVAMAVTWVLTRVFRTPNVALNPEDFERVGEIARVTSAIRPHGFGEIVFEQGGARLVSSARSTDEVAIPHGTEVVILRIERGAAIVAPIEDLLEE